MPLVVLSPLGTRCVSMMCFATSRGGGVGWCVCRLSSMRRRRGRSAPISRSVCAVIPSDQECKEVPIYQVRYPDSSDQRTQVILFSAPLQRTHSSHCRTMFLGTVPSRLRLPPPGRTHYLRLSSDARRGGGWSTAGRCLFVRLVQ